MNSLMKMRQQQQQQTGSSRGLQRRASRRSLFLLKEFGRVGETLDLPFFCSIDYPEGDPQNPDNITSDKYKHFAVRVSPQEGLYAGGTFLIDIDVRGVPEYPEKPPKAKMLTPIWHVNIDTNGNICHNYLKVDECANGGYTPVLGMQGVINGLLTLFFGLENADDPLNPEAAAQFRSDYSAYSKQAKKWTQQYAAQARDSRGC